MSTRTDDHDQPKTAIATDAPTVQARVNVPDFVDRSAWLKRQSRRRRASIGGTSPDGKSFPGSLNPPKHNALRPSRDRERNDPRPPRHRDSSLESTTSSLATDSSYGSTSSRLSVMSTPARRTQQRWPEDVGGGGGLRAAQRTVTFAVAGNGDRGRYRRHSLGNPESHAGVGPAAAAAAAAGTTTLSRSSSLSSISGRCGVCQDEFTRYRRPHRCRACGKAVCATCSPARLPKRTCKRCARGSAAPQVVVVASTRWQPPPAVAPHMRITGVEPVVQAAGVAQAARRSVGSTARVFAGVASKVVSFVAAAGAAAAQSAATGVGGVVEHFGEREREALSNNLDGVDEGSAESGDDDRGEKGVKVMDSLVGVVGEGALEERPSGVVDEGMNELESLDRDRGDVVVADSFADSCRIEGTAAKPPGIVWPLREKSLTTPTRGEKAAAVPEGRGGSLAVISAAGPDGNSAADNGGTSENAGGHVVVPGPIAGIAAADGRDCAVPSQEGRNDDGGEAGEVARGSLAAISAVKMAVSPAAVDGASGHEDVLSGKAKEMPEFVVDKSEASSATSTETASPAPPTAASAVGRSEPSPTDVALHSPDPLLPGGASDSAEGHFDVSGHETGTTADDGDRAVPLDESGGDDGGGEEGEVDVASLATGSLAEVAASPATVYKESGNDNTLGWEARGKEQRMRDIVAQSEVSSTTTTNSAAITLPTPTAAAAAGAFPTTAAAAAAATTSMLPPPSPNPKDAEEQSATMNSKCMVLTDPATTGNLEHRPVTIPQEQAKTIASGREPAIISEEPPQPEKGGEEGEGEEEKGGNVVLSQPLRCRRPRNDEDGCIEEEGVTPTERTGIDIQEAQVDITWVSVVGGGVGDEQQESIGGAVDEVDVHCCIEGSGLDNEVDARNESGVLAEHAGRSRTASPVDEETIWEDREKIESSVAAHPGPGEKREDGEGERENDEARGAGDGRGGYQRQEREGPVPAEAVGSKVDNRCDEALKPPELL
ncbi:unnamed protein product [Pylaiella littoralis]